MLQDHKLRKGSAGNPARLMEAGSHPLSFFSSPAPMSLNPNQRARTSCVTSHTPSARSSAVETEGEPGLFIKTNTIKHMLKITECLTPAGIWTTEIYFSFSEGKESQGCFPRQKLHYKYLDSFKMKCILSMYVRMYNY